jgi:hypothetical protein
MSNVFAIAVTFMGHHRLEGSKSFRGHTQAPNFYVLSGKDQQALVAKPMGVY